MNGGAAMEMTSAVIAACAALGGVWLGNHFTKGREHESDWRKMKLERYREFILALSGNVVERATPETHARCSDAVNGLRLVAPPDVLIALDAYLAHTSFRNPDKSIDRHDQLLSILIRAMRKDLQPAYKGKDENLIFRLQGVAPRDM